MVAQNPDNGEVLDEMQNRLIHLLSVLHPREWTVGETETVVDCMAGLIAARETIPPDPRGANR
jgi:hypothetical protein